MIEYNEFEGNGNENSGRNDVGSGGSSKNKQPIEKKTAKVVCCSISNEDEYRHSYFTSVFHPITHTRTHVHTSTHKHNNIHKPNKSNEYYYLHSG